MPLHVCGAPPLFGAVLVSVSVFIALPLSVLGTAEVSGGSAGPGATVGVAVGCGVVAGVILSGVVVAVLVADVDGMHSGSLCSANG